MQEFFWYNWSPVHGSSIWWLYDGANSDLLQEGLCQHHGSKASILCCSTFFMVQLSHPYMTTGKTIALTRWVFVGKVIALLFNTVSRFTTAFLPRSSFSSFNFVAAITVHSDSGAQENKICHCFHCFPIYLPWSDGTECHNLHFLNAEF